MEPLLHDDARLKAFEFLGLIPPSAMLEHCLLMAWKVESRCTRPGISSWCLVPGHLSHATAQSA